MRRRSAAAGILVVALAVGSACGGDGDDPEPATPAEDVDPTSDNVITGPINKARQTAEDAEDRYEQLEEAP